MFDVHAHCSNAGTLTSRLSSDPRLVDQAFSTATTRQTQAMFTLILGLVLGFRASWRMALVVVASFPINIIASAIQMQATVGTGASAAAAVTMETENGRHDLKEVNKREKKREKKSGETAAQQQRNKGYILATAAEGKPAKFDQSVSQAPVALAAATTSSTTAPRLEENPSSMLSAAFTHMRTVDALSLQHRISERYAQLTRMQTSRSQPRLLVAGAAFGVANGAMMCTNALLFWYGAQLLEDNHVRRLLSYYVW